MRDSPPPRCASIFAMANRTRSRRRGSCGKAKSWKGLGPNLDLMVSGAHWERRYRDFGNPTESNLIKPWK